MMNTFSSAIKSCHTGGKVYVFHFLRVDNELTNGQSNVTGPDNFLDFLLNNQTIQPNNLTIVK